jgi:hypothetical protein
MLLAAAAVTAILIVALATVSPAVPGAGLRALSGKAANAADAKLSGGSTLAAIAPQISKQFAAGGDGIAVIDAQGRTLSQSSAPGPLMPAASSAAIRASLAGSDVRLTAWDASRETASALALVRSKGHAAGVVVASGPVTSSSGVGAGRTAVIVICAALLGALGFLAGRASRPLVRPRSEPTADSYERLVERVVGLEEIAPSGVFVERIRAMLTEAGVQTDDPAGETFDPRRHRAVDRVSTENPALHNTVAETVRPGYSLDGHVLSQAEVAVYRQAER